MYGPPDGEPGLESRDAGNIYYLQGYSGDNKSWLVLSTIVHSSCVSRGLSVTTRYYLLVHPLSNHVRPPIQLQHTDEHTESSRHYPLHKSQHTPLLRNPSCRPAVELTLNGTHNNFPQIICYLLISARTLLVQEPGLKLSYWFLHVFFLY